MLDLLHNLDSWLSNHFPSVALEQLLNPAIAGLIIFLVLIVLGNNNLAGNGRNYQLKEEDEFSLFFGLGLILVFFIGFTSGV